MPSTQFSLTITTADASALAVLAHMANLVLSTDADSLDVIASALEISIFLDDLWLAIDKVGVGDIEADPWLSIFKSCMKIASKIHFAIPSETDALGYK